MCIRDRSYAEQFAKENLIPFKAIPKTDISSVSIQGVENQYYYTGSEIKPEVTVMFGDKKLELEKDYTEMCIRDRLRYVL